MKAGLAPGPKHADEWRLRASPSSQAMNVCFLLLCSCCRNDNDSYGFWIFLAISLMFHLEKVSSFAQKAGRSRCVVDITEAHACESHRSTCV